MKKAPLKSPTCSRCAHDRGLQVPGGIHTVSSGTCANCGKEGPVAPASDYYPPGTPVDWRTMD